MEHAAKSTASVAHNSKSHDSSTLKQKTNGKNKEPIIYDLNRRHLRDIVSQYPSIFLVYATHGLFAKVEDFWENLGFKPIFIQESSGQSDFSEILCPSEVSGGKFNSSRACLFANMMATYGLMDLDRFGGFFTWRKNIQSGGHLRRKKT
ncbi:hypothetical protein JHK82_043218 [Glycine max]|nr:hypothetical protein JHK85_043892 [Glycine max]KAG5106248.1 hypothetical protein JHK82_043218 [Glycine max]